MEQRDQPWTEPNQKIDEATQKRARNSNNMVKGIAYSAEKMDKGSGKWPEPELEKYGKLWYLKTKKLPLNLPEQPIRCPYEFNSITYR